MMNGISHVSWGSLAGIIVYSKITADRGKLTQFVQFHALFPVFIILVKLLLNVILILIKMSS